jgi:hypothetical protein
VWKLQLDNDQWEITPLSFFEKYTESMEITIRYDQWEITPLSFDSIKK